MYALEKTKNQIAENINQVLGNKLIQASDLVYPPQVKMGDLSLACFDLAKVLKKNPKDTATDLCKALASQKILGQKIKFETLGPYLNFRLEKSIFIKNVLKENSKYKNKYGQSEKLACQKILVEYTDPNPFKEFHIGHLVTNSIGESISRIMDFAAAKKIKRLNYQGDVGIHVAKAVWGIKNLKLDLVSGKLEEKVKKLGKAYANGATEFKKSSQFKKEIEEINKKIYEKSDKEINRIYQLGRKISLAYFETIYKKLGTKFDAYFFESKTGKVGKKIIAENKNIFQKSQGALVFAGEKYGLHTRVFLNSENLPTYEAKELGLLKLKFKKYKPDINITITGNEITEYFKVLLKVAELINSEWSKKTIHIPHGMLRLSSGKMSSRTGDVISANSLINQVSKIILEKQEEKDSTLAQKIAIGAIKYSILKSKTGKDIVFDFEKSLSFQGDSGPYLQYTYARIKSVLRKSPTIKYCPNPAKYLKSDKEYDLIFKVSRFAEAVAEAQTNYDPSEIAKYLFELAKSFNDYYHSTPILKSPLPAQKARLVLLKAVAQTLKNGLKLLGIEVVEKM